MTSPVQSGSNNPITSSFQQYREPEPQVPEEDTASAQSNGTHFLERQAVMPPYRSTSSGKTVKIKPMDKELCFDGSNITIERFIKRWEDAGDTDGASSVDLAKQIIPFIKGHDLKEEVEEMSGFEERDWEKLKLQLLNRFGLAQPLVKHPKLDMRALVNSYVDKGGIQTLEEFKTFRTKFESITHYLLRTKHIENLEEYRDQLLEVLSPEFECSVARELSKDKKDESHLGWRRALTTFSHHHHLHSKRGSASISHEEETGNQETRKNYCQGTRTQEEPTSYQNPTSSYCSSKGLGKTDG